jgi:hypothetical protein
MFDFNHAESLTTAGSLRKQQTENDSKLPDRRTGIET